MATDQPINANRKNAQCSTRLRTESGKAVSSCDAVTLGLFTETDYARVDEQSEDDQINTRCLAELKPAGFIEESFVISIVSARWRLRRCAVIERA